MRMIKMESFQKMMSSKPTLDSLMRLKMASDSKSRRSCQEKSRVRFLSQRRVRQHYTSVQSKIVMRLSTMHGFKRGFSYSGICTTQMATVHPLTRTCKLSLCPWHPRPLSWKSQKLLFTTKSNLPDFAHLTDILGSCESSGVMRMSAKFSLEAIGSEGFEQN